MARSTVFKSNRSQAVRLPKEVAFPSEVHQVEIIKIGHSRIISPVGKRWDDFFARKSRPSDDFFAARQQPSLEKREDF